MSLTYEQEQTLYERLKRQGIYRTHNYVPVKVETKQERVKRVANEKMLASFSLYNKKYMNVNEVIQICKPRNKINNYR